MFIVQNNQSYRSLYRSVSPTHPPTQTVILLSLVMNKSTEENFPKYFESFDVQPSSLTVDILLEKVEKLQGSDKKLHLLSLLRKIRSWKLFITQFWIKELIVKLPFYNTRKQAHDKKTKLSKQYRGSQKKTHFQNATERPQDKNDWTDPRAHSEIPIIMTTEGFWPEDAL